MVCLKPEENYSSHPKEEVMMSTMVGHRADRHALNKSVAEGSREQVDAFVFAGTRSCWWRTLAWRKSKSCNSLVGVNEVDKVVVGKEEHCGVVLLVTDESKIVLLSGFRESNLWKSSHGLCRLLWCARSFVESLQLATRGLHGVMVVYTGEGDRADLKGCKRIQA